VAATPVDPEFVARRTLDVTLPDGVRIRLRPIVPEDKPRLIEGLSRLSPESRYRRFMGPIDHFTSAQLAYLTEIDYHDHFALIAIAPDEPGEPGVGVARYIRLREDPEAADAAVVVLDNYQGRGIGTLLLEAIGAVAIENGIRKFRGYLLAENSGMINALKHFGAKVEFDSTATLRFEIDLPDRMAELKKTGLYRVLREVARGEKPGYCASPSILGVPHKNAAGSRPS
jgi:GNAT superfamily N-acetyltransferase